MTNRQLDMENIDRVDNLVYTPLEKRYLKARIGGTVLAYACRFLSCWRSQPSST